MPRSQTPVVSLPARRDARRDCCLPLCTVRRRFFPSVREGILVGHNVQISGLNSAACTFATPGFIHPVTGMHAGSLRTCWLGFGPVGLAFLAAHRLGNISEFQCLLSSSPRFGFSLARIHRCSAWYIQERHLLCVPLGTMQLHLCISIFIMRRYQSCRVCPTSHMLGTEQ